MENLLLIVFFIALSIISSILKKKGQPQAPQKGRNIPGNIPDRGGRQPAPPAAPKSGQEILEEVQKILRGEMPEPDYAYNRAPEPQPPLIAEETEQVEEFVNHEFDTPMVPQVKTEYEVVKQEYANDARFQFSNTPAFNLLCKLQNVKNFKEYYIISEILGKPKALQRK